jgi:hypothetical protein
MAADTIASTGPLAPDAATTEAAVRAASSSPNFCRPSTPSISALDNPNSTADASQTCARSTRLSIDKTLLMIMSEKLYLEPGCSAFPIDWAGIHCIVAAA